MNDLITIGNIVREIRKSNKQNTQEKFAELIDASVETVSNIERGLVLISTKTLANIAENCDVSTDKILGTGDYSNNKENT